MKMSKINKKKTGTEKRRPTHIKWLMQTAAGLIMQNQHVLLLRLLVCVDTFH
jgi:hypothetical protein